MLIVKYHVCWLYTITVTAVLCQQKYIVAG